MSKKINKKKNKRKNLLINILAGFLILLSIALIFNAKIRDIFMVWNTNKYQVSQVSKEKLEEKFKRNNIKELEEKEILKIEVNINKKKY